MSVGVAVATARLLFNPHTHANRNTHIPKSLCECWRALRKGSHISVNGGSLFQHYTAAQCVLKKSGKCIIFILSVLCLNLKFQSTFSRLLTKCCQQEGFQLNKNMKKLRQAYMAYWYTLVNLCHQQT